MNYTQTAITKWHLTDLGPLQHIPQPPTHLYIQANNWRDLARAPRVAVIGSRKTTAYGRTVSEQLVQELTRAGVVIVSGLALGIDSIAHQACLAAGGRTIAVLPGGLNTIYPAAHQHLAQQIVAQGGALVSEYEPLFRAQKWSFIERNRLVAGLADVLLVTEAAEKSGTLHTANFALDQGRPVLAVPGNITSPASKGTNRLISTGATPVLSTTDVFEALGMAALPSTRTAPTSSNPDEQVIIDLLRAGAADGNKLLCESRLSITVFNQALTMLEIQGVIRALGNNQWQLHTN